MDASGTSRRHARATARAGVLAVLAAVLGLAGFLQRGGAFVGATAPAIRLQQGPALPGTVATRRRAEGGEVVDAEVLGDEEEEPEEAEEEAAPAEGQAYPPEAYKDYTLSKNPPKSYFERRKIDRMKVNQVFFDMYKKPKSFFPHKLQPGDTVRVSYLDARSQGDGEFKELKIDTMRLVYFDGVIMDFKGELHARTMTLRAMVGKGEGVMGMEMKMPMHSPLVRKIEVLRRGYIGRNKNAYFIRGMVGKRNVIPLDQERTQMDEVYALLREEKREDEIPESEYPQTEHDRYPLPVWKQDQDDWDEEQYDPENVDKRTQYETRVIAHFRKRVPGPTGKQTRR